MMFDPVQVISLMLAGFCLGVAACLHFRPVVKTPVGMLAELARLRDALWSASGAVCYLQGKEDQQEEVFGEFYIRPPYAFGEKRSRP